MFNYLFNTYESVDSPFIDEDIFLNNFLKGNLTDSILDSLEELSKVQSYNSYPGVSDELIPLPNKESLNSELDNHLELIIYRDERLNSPRSFEEAFQEACRINPEVRNYRTFLIKTAKRESGFNSSIRNTAGAPNYGYFQMGKEEIRKTTGLTILLFRNNPVLLILGAVKLYKMNLTAIKNLGVYNLGREKGYSDDALVSGAWMGGPGGVKKYLLGQGDPSDSHWYHGKGGSSVGRIMNLWRLYE